MTPDVKPQPGLFPPPPSPSLPMATLIDSYAVGPLAVVQAEIEAVEAELAVEQ